MEGVAIITLNNQLMLTFVDEETGKWSAAERISRQNALRCIAVSSARSHPARQHNETVRSIPTRYKMYIKDTCLYGYTD